MHIKKVGEIFALLCVIGVLSFVYKEGQKKVKNDPKLVSWANGMTVVQKKQPVRPLLFQQKVTTDLIKLFPWLDTKYTTPLSNPEKPLVRAYFWQKTR